MFAHDVLQKSEPILYASIFLLGPHRLTLTHPVPETLISCRQSHHPIIRESITSLPANTVEVSMCCLARRDTGITAVQSAADSFHRPIVNGMREILQSSYGCSERFSRSLSFCLSFGRDTHGYSYSVK